MARIDSTLVAIWLLIASFLSTSLALPSFYPAQGVPVLLGSAASMGAGTYPRANRLADGTLIGAYTSFKGKENLIVITKSTDNGNSWQSYGVAHRGIGDIDNPYPLQLPSGRILVAYRNHVKSPTGEYLNFRISISYSDDHGSTWAPLCDPASDPGPVNGNWEPFLRNAQDGKTLQIYYSRENSAADQDSLMRTSIDGGQTWSTATVISGQDRLSRDGMLGVAVVRGSELIAVFESEQNGLFAVDSIRSRDDGQTWGDRRRVYTPTGTNNNAGAPQVVNVGGTLVVSFMTDEDTQLHRWIEGSSAKVVVSTDGGRNWGNSIIVGAVQSNWPGMVVVGDVVGERVRESQVLVMFDQGGCKVQRLSFDAISTQ